MITELIYFVYSIIYDMRYFYEGFIQWTLISERAEKYMSYIVKRIDEDLDFGCEERAEDAPVMAVVTLMNSSGEELRIRAEDAMLYERNINEGDKVYFDKDNKLEKVLDEK